MRYFRDSIRSLDSYLASERAAEDYCNEVVDGEGRLQYLDSSAGSYQSRADRNQIQPTRQALLATTVSTRESTSH